MSALASGALTPVSNSAAVLLARPLPVCASPRQTRQSSGSRLDRSAPYRSKPLVPVYWTRSIVLTTPQPAALGCWDLTIQPVGTCSDAQTLICAPTGLLAYSSM